MRRMVGVMFIYKNNYPEQSIIYVYHMIYKQLYLFWVRKYICMFLEQKLYIDSSESRFTHDPNLNSVNINLYESDDKNN